jgi:hypothetical protein
VVLMKRSEFLMGWEDIMRAVDKGCLCEQKIEGKNELSMRNFLSTTFTYIESTSSIYA